MTVQQVTYMQPAADAKPLVPFVYSVTMAYSVVPLEKVSNAGTDASPLG
jgi:hypothetical protein